MYTNLHTLSRSAGVPFVPNRFLAVAGQYGIHSLRQTVGTVKFAVWKSFTDTVHIYNELISFYCCTFLLCLCLHFVATFWCNK